MFRVFFRKKFMFSQIVGKQSKSGWISVFPFQIFWPRVFLYLHLVVPQQRWKRSLQPRLRRSRVAKERADAREANRSLCTRSEALACRTRPECRAGGCARMELRAAPLSDGRATWKTGTIAARQRGDSARRTRILRWKLWNENFWIHQQNEILAKIFRFYLKWWFFRFLKPPLEMSPKLLIFFLFLTFLLIWDWSAELDSEPGLAPFSAVRRKPSASATAFALTFGPGCWVVARTARRCVSERAWSSTADERKFVLPSLQNWNWFWKIFNFFEFLL